MSNIRFHSWIKTYHEDPENVPIAGFLTKIDIPHHHSVDLQFMDYCKMKGWGMEKTSAKQDVNVQDSFFQIIKSVLKQKFGLFDENEEVQKDLRPDIIVPSVPSR